MNANRITAYSVRQRGFTMAEVLVVMAIIMILSGIGIPNGLRMMNSARQISLNRAAETIYMTAQRNLIAYKLQGNSTPPTSTNNIVSSSDSRIDTDNNFAPNAAVNIILPTNTISPSLCAGNWKIQYNDSFQIEKVYYSEDVPLADFDRYENSIGKIGSYG